MGINELQEFIETHCSGACLSVDLLKISRSFVPKRRGRYPGNGRFCLIVDAESCLDRLYGGFFSDWVCGGQWNRMLQFLGNLMQACQTANMDLVVFFNGALESQQMDQWYASQVGQKKKVNMVLRHINNKGTPPPKVWWNPPVFLIGALKMALRHLGVGIACSMDDHHQEVIGFCREHGLQGILGQDSVYAIFDPPRYFSSQNLKLTYKGSLETKEYVMDEIAKCLDLNPNRFCLFAALLGNHILTEEDLYEFFKELLARAAQDSGKSVKPSPENVIRAVVDYVRSLPDISNIELVGEPIFRNSKGNKQELASKLRQSVQYYSNGTQDGFLKYRPRAMQGNFNPAQPPPPLMKQDNSGYADEIGDQVGVNGINGAGPNAAHTSWQAKKGPKTKVRGQEIEMPPIAPEIMRIASERHQKGLMSPWIYQVLSQGEVKMVVTLEDDTSRELPTSIDLYRPIRQTIYSVLLNLNKLKIINDTQSKDKVDASGAAPKSFEVPIKEWVVRRTGSQKPSFDLVMAKPVDWKTPSIERMWLGQHSDDKTRRLRAFLTCMMSDSPLMLNTNYVQQHLLILCCVLRYMLQFGRVLQRQELDAFLAMSVSPLLHDVQTMQDLKLPSVHPRGVALAALFMAGVETAQCCNDVCGSPIPWNMVCPWQYFDGKLFHFKLLKANNNTPLIDMCDGQILRHAVTATCQNSEVEVAKCIEALSSNHTVEQVEQVLRVERMRQAIMEGLQVEFARPLLPHHAAMYAGYPYPAYPGPHPGPQGPPYPIRPAGMGRMPPHPAGRGMPPMGYMDPMGPEGPLHPGAQGRGRGILGRSPVDARGGQLEIAGVVVGSWASNMSSGGRGRGGGNQMSPRVMSVGGPRRGGVRGGMYYRGRGRGPPMPMYRMTPVRGVVRGTRRPAVRARPRPGKPRGDRPAGKGRGMTVEATGGNTAVVSVNDVTEDDDNDSSAIFEDAEDGSSGPSKTLMQNGLPKSPDSGIQGDKSATELTV